MTTLNHDMPEVVSGHWKISRFKASGIHLCISVLIGIASFFSFWFVWYPEPLFSLLDGIHIYTIILCVDVSLGPLLTLILWKQGKRGLKFDMTCIIVVQIAALIYGGHTLWAGRPVFIAALADHFDVIRVNDIDPQDLAESKRGLPIWGPEWVSTHAPANGPFRNRVVFAAVQGKDYGHFPQLHVPLAPDLDKLYQKAYTIEALEGYNKGQKAAIQSWLDRHGADRRKIKYLPLHSSSGDGAVFMDGSKIIGMAAFTPW